GKGQAYGRIGEDSWVGRRAGGDAVVVLDDLVIGGAGDVELRRIGRKRDARGLIQIDVVRQHCAEEGAVSAVAIDGVAEAISNQQLIGAGRGDLPRVGENCSEQQQQTANQFSDVHLS